MEDRAAVKAYSEADRFCKRKRTKKKNQNVLVPDC
jgi:hypothetical protein